MATFNTYQGSFTTGCNIAVSGGETEVGTGSGTIDGLQVDAAGDVTGTVTETGSETVVIDGSDTEVDSLDTSGPVSGTLSSLFYLEFPTLGITLHSTLASFSFSQANGTTVLKFSDKITANGIAVEPGVTVNVSGYLNATLTAADLFTTGTNIVNFNNLTSAQQAAIVGGADIYHGLGGNDVVTLPNETNYEESIGDGQTLGWTDTSASTFYTGSRVGDTYTVTGGDGDYYIVEGAGKELITIDGDGDSAITAGSGVDNISINGDGHSTIAAGSGSEVVSISGGGTLDITGGFVGSATIGAGSTLELGGAASGGLITFAPSGADETLQIDGAKMPTNVISGFAPGDTIDLRGVPYNSQSGATLFETNTVNNVLEVVENGKPYDLPAPSIAEFFGRV